MYLRLLALVPVLFPYLAPPLTQGAPLTALQEPAPGSVRSIMMPHVWMRARKALIEAHRQAGLVYAVLPAQFEAPVGPFPIDRPVSLDELLARTAEATNTETHKVAEVVIFDGRVDEKDLVRAFGASGWSGSGPQRTWDYSLPVPQARSTRSERGLLEALSRLGHSSSIPGLVRLASSRNPSIRLHALAALQRLEGDFIRNTWPGRRSIFEVLASRFERDSLLFALEEGGPVGGRTWKLAAELLGRAREPLLTRGVWWNLWELRPGTIPLTLWCMGRCGDPSGSGPLGERVWELATNDVADLHLGTIALGQVDAVTLLAGRRNAADPNIRRAVAMGLGSCSSRSEAVEALEPLLQDADPVVRFIACQSLGRLGATQRLFQFLSDDFPVENRLAALEALLETGQATKGLASFGLQPEPQSAIPASAMEQDPVLLAGLADAYGRKGGIPAFVVLSGLLEHRDRWVRAAAAKGLAELGTQEAILRIAGLAASTQEDADIRIASVIGLGRSLAPSAAEPLGRIAGNPAEHYRLRQYAVQALCRLAKHAGQSWVAPLVDTKSPGFLPFALRYVRLGTREETAKALIPFLTHGDRDSACAAAGNLSELGGRLSTRELLEGSDIFDNHTRMTHNWGAIRAEGEEALAGLLEASLSPRSRIRHGAALALGNRLRIEAVEGLLRLAEDGDAGVRAAAAQSLGLSGDVQAVPALLRLLTEDPAQTVRTEAARALRSRDFANHAAVLQATARLAVGEAAVGGPASRRPSMAAQEAHTFVLRDWTEAYEENATTNLTYETTLCYDSHSCRIIAWGAHGRRYDSPQTGLTWFFDVARGAWNRLLNSRQWPNGTCCNRQIVFDPNRKLAIIPKSGGGGSTGGHGWLNGLRGNLSYSIPWTLDVVADEWYPMRPSGNLGSLGMVGGSYDPLTGMAVWWNGELSAYDADANRWLRLRPDGQAPAFSVNNSAVFDPRTGKLIVIGPDSTWAWDPADNRWQDLKPAGDAAPVEAPMVYDVANDVMLAFKEAGEAPMGVWVYHLRGNRWEKLPEINPAPRYGTMFDVAYDVKNNLVVVSGNESMSWSGALTARETWTYRYRPVAEPGQPDAGRRPANVKVATRAKGKATVTWDPAVGDDVIGYSIFRKVSGNPYEGTWEKIGRASSSQSEYQDLSAPGSQEAFYAVSAEYPSPSQCLRSLPARTAPAAPRWAFAVVTRQGIRVEWQPSSSAEVEGYHVYRAEADLGWPWHDRFDPQLQAGDFTRLTDRPETATQFLDAAALVQGPATELHWPKTFVYLVRPVNQWGIEGGTSPLTLALADPPGPVHEVPWLDGRRLLFWNPSRSDQDLRGYHILRMDDWHRDYVFRWQAAPVAGTAFFDDEEDPRADRRLYFVAGVDSIGGVGIPSSECWSHGLP